MRSVTHATCVLVVASIAHFLCVGSTSLNHTFASKQNIDGAPLSGYFDPGWPWWYKVTVVFGFPGEYVLRTSRFSATVEVLIMVATSMAWGGLLTVAFWTLLRARRLRTSERVP